MYVHKIISNLLDFVNIKTLNTNELRLVKFSKSIMNIIKNSQTFYVGKQYIVPTNKDFTRFLTNFNKNDIRMPYSKILFEMDIDTHIITNNGKKILVTKNALLCCELSSRIILMIVLIYNSQLDCWVPTSMINIFSLYGTITPADIDYQKLEKLLYIKGEGILKLIQFHERRLCCDVIGHLTPEEMKMSNESLMHRILIFEKFLQLLSCKNVKSENIEPSMKLNKKRKKKGKLPILSYKILKLKLPGVSNKSSDPKNLWTNRIHLCRGHFKIFTEDKPLFGRKGGVGKYWWQPMLRGRNKKGAVIKEYDVSLK